MPADSLRGFRKNSQGGCSKAEAQDHLSRMSVSSPVVSVITATYNRSNVLRYTIESLQRSSFTDWEQLVIGDACTDDTEQVVASFRDSRVRFINLERNTGEQSGPNNEGFRYSRGRYIAYLNHDDLWFPDHLEVSLRGIEETGADLVFTLRLIAQRDGPNLLAHATKTGRYEPYVDVAASSWLLRRELVEEVGPWRFYRECYSTPSQNWLYRAWRMGKDLRLIPRLTGVGIQSGNRPGVYAARESHENLLYFERMVNEPDFRECQLEALAWNYAARSYGDVQILSHASRAAKNLVKRVAMLLRLPPAAVILFLQYRRKGGFIDSLRRRRGIG